MLYETFISVSETFKELMIDVTRQVREAKVYEWENKDEAKQFFDFLVVLFNGESSISRIML